MASMTSLTNALVFHWRLSLSLNSGGGGVVGLSLSFVLGGLILMLLVDIFLVFFRQQAMVFWAFGIDFANIEEWLQVSLCFCITFLLYHFFLHI